MKAPAFRMSDIAKLAGVSATTVSNVVNHRESVAASTRARVELILTEVGFERNRHAAALRRQGTVLRQASPGKSGGSMGQGKVLSYSQEEEFTGDPEVQGAKLKRNFGVGDRIRFYHEQQVVQAEVDEWMPDGSGLWVWCWGIGRKFLSLAEGPLILSESFEEAVAADNLRKQSGGCSINVGVPAPFT